MRNIDEKGNEYLEWNNDEHLIQLVRSGSVTSVEDFIKNYSCNINTIHNGYSPLNFAVSSNQTAMTQLLLKHGANPHIGRGVQHLISYAEHHENHELVNLIQSAAAGNEPHSNSTIECEF